MLNFKCNTTQTMDFCYSFVNLQAHALLCMNNMVNSVEVDWLGGTEKLHQVWSSLASLLANIDGE